VRAFLLTMRKAGLTLKLEKCKFAQSSVTFVGHTIGSGLHGPNPHKVACVQDMKPPNSKKEVRQILGFFSYFRTYIDRFAGFRGSSQPHGRFTETPPLRAVYLWTVVLQQLSW